MKVLRKFAAAAALAITSFTSAHAAVMDYEAIPGGTMSMEDVTISGGPGGFMAAGFAWDMNVTISPATGLATLFDGFTFDEVLSLTLVEQEFAPGSYTGVFNVLSDTTGTWGSLVLIEVDGAIDASGDGKLTASAAALASAPPVIPLPAGGALLLTGLLGLAVLRRRTSR